MNTMMKVKELFTPLESIPTALIAWDESGKIAYAGPENDAPPLKGETLDRSNLSAMPGLIDIHVHGGWGVEFGSGDLRQGLKTYSKKVISRGVTGFLVTVSGPSHAAILNILESYAALLDETYPGAVPLGFHLEGPFLNPERHGAFNPDWLHNPSIEKIKDFTKAAGGYLRQVSLAPELENAFETAAFLREKGIRVALAHSSADYDTAAKALAGDFTHITHTFNAQSAFHHREPGVVGAILTSNNTSAELIADTVHVHPAAMRVLLRCLGAERVVLITDAMPGAGLGDGEYTLIGQKVTLKDGRAALPDGTLAGSIATLDTCLRNIVFAAGASPLDAARMASYNPATVIGMDERIGCLTPGHDANITLVDEKLGVEAVFLRGKLQYQRG